MLILLQESAFQEIIRYETVCICLKIISSWVQQGWGSTFLTLEGKVLNWQINFQQEPSRVTLRCEESISTLSLNFKSHPFSSNYTSSSKRLEFIWRKLLSTNFFRNASRWWFRVGMGDCTRPTTASVCEIGAVKGILRKLLTKYQPFPTYDSSKVKLSSRKSVYNTYTLPFLTISIWMKPFTKSV